jgi:hypothetical protein
VTTTEWVGGLVDAISTRSSAGSPTSTGKSAFEVWMLELDGVQTRL